MRGLLADVNVQGQLLYLHQLMMNLELWPVLAELDLELATFRELNLLHHLENRNHDGPDSLHATLMDSWRVGHFPVITLANKSKFSNSRAYSEQVAIDVAELLFGIKQGEYRDQARIFVPLSTTS